MSTSNYYTVDGQILGYSRKDYLTDALGSVTSEIDQTGNTRTFDGRYKPFGGTLTSTGTRGSYGWVGRRGYRETGLKASSHYIRARHYNTSSGTWLTVDPLWPILSPYGYTMERPVLLFDPSGLGPNVCVSGSQSLPVWGGFISVEAKYKICGATYDRRCCPMPGATTCFSGEIGIALHISVLGGLSMLKKLATELLATLAEISEFIESLSHLSVQAQDAEEGCPAKGYTGQYKGCIEVCLAFVTISACSKDGKFGFEPPE